MFFIPLLNISSEPPKKRILVIEDNPETQLIFKVYMRDFYDVEVCDSAEEGIKKLDSEDFTLALLDINLPGDLDGNDVLLHVRKKQKNMDFPIIVITAYAMKGDREKFLALGANDYLSKPIDKLSLLNKIRSLIEPD
jgi:CheY-like chemotaxis protein